jgi:hypothetical protein
LIPWIDFQSILPKGGVSTMSDILFLAVKEYDSKILENSGNRTIACVLCEIDVPDGNTFYLAYANA